ncbi:bifunctional phosphoribosyl-AMP cyclohydrolase/phosphoribosyl-ATP diphosphatase HisIE [Cyclobacterium marinum]|uniref:Histidine biosynthesis bifunctional protein HisIE n=1 Tax=Cyclobacterium marinum (strain ATCC 25205 / DSM 745 / LMG 13164 / NCIMB 1802) TaxID=880070 RepID=G0J006_CYCMS|nr:bifunctional phosphoribosyl-AMP cyclohydrolase/phosphoribosyl-ATP diphosphatase HisIE [Cyclobacterium marinum]AEL26508.1 Histidine biosynthesis bifunctional protein hisIE [Cyclobacterium marinum DSM 745]MBI0399841.1 bifunctional phosphoribosyl-AMP cyclohydrolase/phosphoribosyl-ATP diphosphatase HisIE [Cyclobacterium marinum]MBR9776151.1 bifunctional phosphoribosyl-AMP cyclohydrolase/phosphoribosyl-ATP diphosphatase HisIE [Cytophagales bacterium]|tara:strand:- start:52523 stop:53128 length:606 start_codon:yes stop_codon:yes gene_type:complete
MENINIDFEKVNGLVPAIIQDEFSKEVLMMGYMNQEAIDESIKSGKVTFFSRTKGRLWTKGETSGNFLMIKNIEVDCDQDTLLITVNPIGPVCHTGNDTCFAHSNKGKTYFIDQLRKVIKERKENPSDKSYTTSLFNAGINKVAQKVGEEAVEIVIEAKDDNKELFMGEAADLLYHYLVLLEAKEYELDEVMEVLIKRHKK